MTEGHEEREMGMGKGYPLPTREGSGEGKWCYLLPNRLGVRERRELPSRVRRRASAENRFQCFPGATERLSLRCLIYATVCVGICLPSLGRRRFGPLLIGSWTSRLLVEERHIVCKASTAHDSHLVCHRQHDTVYQLPSSCTHQRCQSLTCVHRDNIESPSSL